MAHDSSVSTSSASDDAETDSARDAASPTGDGQSSLEAETQVRDPEPSPSSAPSPGGSASADGSVSSPPESAAPPRVHQEKASDEKEASDEAVAGVNETGAGKEREGQSPGDEPSAVSMAGHSVWVKDIVSRTPSWPLRYGNVTFLLIIVSALVACWFIRYPDVVRAPVTFQSSQAPVRVVAPSSRTVEHVFVEEKETVDQDQPLVLLRNSASYADVRRLRTWHDRAGGRLQDRESLTGLGDPPTGLQAGPIQDAYMAVMQRLSDYKTFHNDPARADKRRALKDRIDEHRALAATYERQSSILDERVNIREQKYERNQQLREQGMVSNDVVEESKNQVLTLRYQLRDLQAKQANNRIQAARTESELANLRQTWADRTRTLRLLFLQAYERLGNRLKDWRQNYLVTAPLGGRITFFDVIQAGRHVRASQNILAVVPSSQEVRGRVLLPPRSIGDVEEGQSVLIALDSPSSEEVGKIKGVVSDVSLVSGEKTYRVQVALPNGLVTEFGHELNLRQEMPGTAEIITEDHRLLMRMLNWLRVLLSDNVSA